MAESEVLVKALKDLPNRIQTGSLKERRCITENVISVLSNPGINDKIVNGICKVIHLTLPRYSDSNSHYLIKTLLAALLKEHPKWTIKYMLIALQDIAAQNKNVVSTSNTAHNMICALQWTCIIITSGVKLNTDELKKDISQLIEIQCVLLLSIVAAGNKKISEKAYNILRNRWKSIPNGNILYLDTLKNTEQTNTAAVMGAFLAKYQHQCKKLQVLEPYRPYLLDIFIKSIISTKTKPLPSVIENCYALLKLITHDEFKTILLPALTKAMLRNPEIILECVGLVISGINIDLSKYCVDIGKSLSSHLHSKDELARNEALDAYKRLAKQCSDAARLEVLLKNIFDVFNGSDGKLTVVEHKMSVLQATGNLSYNSVSGSGSQTLALTAVELYQKVLNIEVHEKTVCHTIEMMSLWCEKFSNEIPQKVIDLLKNAFSSKNATPAIRTSYIQCMSICFRGNTIHQMQQLVNPLLKTVDRAAAQPTQGPVVTEGLCAACLLLKYAVAQGEKNVQLGNLWNVVLDMDKQIFVGEKFLAVASDNALIHVMKLCEHLLLSYPEKLNGKAVPIHKAIVHCLIVASGVVRQKCLPVVKKMVTGLGGALIARALLKEMLKFYETAKIEKISEREFKETNDNSAEISPHTLVKCLLTLCSAVNVLSEDAQNLALDALLPTHHPAIVEISPNLWLKIATHLRLKPKEFITKHANKIKKMLIEDYVLSPCMENALAMAVRINPDVILPTLVENVTNKLNDPSMLKVTKDDYFIFLTPEGELYDKSVIPGNDESTLNAMNMKRESKAYSYKEQLEELQLRRELEEKKRKEGKIKEPQYSSKQLEIIKAQRDKEQSIRNRLTQLNSVLLNCVSMIEAAIKGNRSELSLYFRDLLPAIVTVTHSPLAAPYFTKLFVDLRKTVFGNDLLSEIIAHVTLRLLSPQCDLDSAWEEEELSKAIVRTMNLIHTRTIKNKDKELDSDVAQDHFTAPMFCYTFYFLKLSMTSKYAKGDEELLHHGLQIISDHAKLRAQSDLGDKDPYNPRFLPRKELFSLLVELIRSVFGWDELFKERREHVDDNDRPGYILTSTDEHHVKEVNNLVSGDSVGRIQSQAVSTLLDVAESANISTGGVGASTEEISILLTALQNPSDVVRDCSLRALTSMVDSFAKFEKKRDLKMLICRRVWVARHDVNEGNQDLATKLWELAHLSYPVEKCDLLLSDIEHPVECIQQAASKALAILIENHTKLIEQMVQKLLKLYRSRLAMIPSKQDEFGRVIEQPIDTWSPRRGVGLALTQLAPLLTPDTVEPLVKFFVQQSLGDRNQYVRKEMLTAALAVIEIHGKSNVSTLLPVFEQFMDKTPKSGNFDAVRQAVVILMGSLARHLDKDDARIKPIVIRLISALSTPSEQVQEAVANCLPHLVPSVKDEAPNLVNKLLHQLLKSDKYGDRRGAAYGLAGLVKGMGILALKQLDIMTKLTEAIQDKKNYRHREGALFAFEMLCNMLGRLFEPYIVHVLPHLLLCFGDTSQYVRNATDDTARVVMSKLSAHGVKLVLPSLLAALEEDSWRTKTGSVELLGAMAFCAPKQLSSCLPSIVPKLIEVLSDSHMKVQEAGAEALKVIGSVIRNPEIQAIVPVLLQALQDPSNKTSVCLQTLLDTQFVHFIDAPSLALIMPVVQRAFMDRSTETRKMAAQIIGNMYSLTDQKDLTPYLPTIIPGLKTSLLDPVPEVRSVSARALGAMVRGMGESSFEDLLPWLMQTLTSETSSVDRSGAAQGLSEVVGGLGVEKLHKLMPEIISTAERADIAPHVKDGYIMMFIYMPVVFTNEFTPYIGQIINPILKALADENEYVRDTALKAGQRIVNLYADSAIMLLLPELEKGLFDDNWRIRYSSVQLLGDLLYRISGVTGKMSTETASEDDNFGTEQSHSAIIKALGGERRNRVLAGLYMGRSDVALMVRQSALHVWKVVVTNTPRTLREILPTLFGLLLGCLASTSYDKRQVAARTLGDLVRKLGERVLPEIIPILERGLQSDQPDQRQGVCIGLSEIMASTSKEMVLTFVNSLVPTVRKALCDPLPEVRHAAAKTFDSLHSTVGVRALDDILPAMLNQLNDADSELAECTLDGLRQVMAIKSRVVLPYLVPQLTASPVNTKALSILASVAGEALNKYLHKILPALLQALSTAQGTPHETQQLEYCQAVVLSVSDEIGVRTIMDQLLEYTKSESVEQRRSAATLLCAFCATTRVDYTMHVPQLLRGLIHLCTDSDKDVLQMSWEALNAVTKTLEPKQQATYVADVRQSVRYAMSDMKGTSDLLPGFCLPKGITPILPIFREAILNGDGDEKEAAAQGLGEVIKVTSAQALQPSVVAITGPLIRILGDRFSWNVKAAVLETLAILLGKVGVMLKQFLPQLQTTFLKALNDTNRQVRIKAATALSHLIVIHVRADPLFTDLHNGVKNSDDSAVRETMLQALRGVITPAGDKMSEPLRKQIHATLLGMLGHPEDATRGAVAGCLGALCRWLNEDQLDSTLIDHLLYDDPQNDWMMRHGRSAAVFVALKESPGTLWTEQYQNRIVKILLSWIQADRVPVAMNSVRACGYLFQHIMMQGTQLPHQLLVSFVRTMNHSSNDVKQLLARVCTHLAKAVPQNKMAPELLKLVLPTLVNGTKEKNSYVKANSEIALIQVLRLREGDDMHQKCLNLLDIGARESLSDVVSKVLRKVMSQPEGKEEELDDTLIT